MQISDNFRPVYFGVLAAFSLSGCFVVHAEETVAPVSRTWTTLKGTEFQGTLMNVFDNSVVILLDDGDQIKGLLGSLSEADRRHCRSFADMLVRMKAPLAKSQLQPGETFHADVAKAEPPHIPEMNYTCVLRNGVPEGRTLYFSNKKLVQVEEHRGGQLHGTKVLFFPTGELYAISYMERGIPVGVSATFFPTGEIFRLTEYQDGKLGGMTMYFRDTGRKKHEYPYVDGVKSGESKHYTSTGELYGRQIWKNDQLVEKFKILEIDSREYAKQINEDVNGFAGIWDRGFPYVGDGSREEREMQLMDLPEGMKETPTEE